MLLPDHRYPNLRILTLSKEADAKRLRFILSNEYRPNTVQGLDDNKNLQQQEPHLAPPARRLAELLLPYEGTQSLGVRSVVLELDYVDRDSNIAYSLLHARAFRDYPRRTSRLHFLKQELTSYEQLMDERFIQDSYVGFCVLSATQPGNLGRTVLPPPSDESTQLFIPSESGFSANLGGSQLRVSGTAFLQQDGRVAACASAAAWMSTIMLPRRFGFDMSVYSVAEITKLATKYSLPRMGVGTEPALAIQQVLWALKEMGYEPIANEAKDPDVITELIYCYVESGIPPILVLCLPEQKANHAVTVVGHTYSQIVDSSLVDKNPVLSTKAWCPYFLIHDDQAGMYIKIKIDTENSKSEGMPRIIFDGSSSNDQEYKGIVSKWYHNAYLKAIIAPLPPRHTLIPEKAAAKGQAIITKAYNLYDSFFEVVQKGFPKTPIYRTYLVPSNEFKQSFISKKIGGQSRKKRYVCDELAHWYRGSSYPRYIWVTELCDFDHKNERNLEDLRILGDVTIDPTSCPFSTDFVTLHLPHAFFRMFPSTTRSIAELLRVPTGYIADDEPYVPFMRTPKD